MTRFEKDLKRAQEDPEEGIQILRERAEELDEIWRKGKAEKNGFRRECLAQEYTRLKAQFDEIDSYL